MAQPDTSGIVYLKRRAWEILRDEYGWKCQYDGRLHELFDAIFISLFEFIGAGGLMIDDPVTINDMVETSIPSGDKYPNDPEAPWLP